MQEIILETSKQKEMIDITQRVAEIVKCCEKKNSFCIVHARHTTAAIAISENYGPNITIDTLDCLGQWEGVRLCEFDGTRKRKLMVGVVKDAM